MTDLLLFVHWDVSPRVFPFWDLPRWYGLLWAVGVICGYLTMQYVYRREGRSTERFDLLAMYLLAGGLVGARLGHVFFYEPAYYLAHPVEILPIRLTPSFRFTGFAGLASHGGAIGVLVALYWYCRRFGEHYIWILDRLVIAAVLTGSFIRFGNLMNSEVIGTPTRLPWAFIFERVDDLPRHPAQLYEAIYGVFLFAFLFKRWSAHRYSWIPGSQLGWFMVGLFSLRILVEFIKADQVPFEAGMFLNMGQLLSIPFLILGILILWRGIPQRFLKPTTS